MIKLPLRKHKTLSFLLAMLLVIVFGYFYLNLQSKTNTLMVHPDEYDYVARGAFLNLIVNGDFSNKAWRTYDSYVHEKLPSYLYRIPFLIFQINDNGITSFQHEQSSWWGKIGHNQSYQEINYNTVLPDNWIWDSIYKNYPNIQSLPNDIQQRLSPILIARKVALLFSFGSLILFMYILTLKGWGIPFSLFGTILLFHSHIFQNSTLRAQGDTFLLFFLLLSLYLGLKWQKNLFQKQHIYKTIILGLVCGLSVASKMNGLFSLIYIFGILSIRLLSKFSFSSFLYYLKNIFIIAVISFGIFITINPFTWKNPINDSIFIIQHRINETKYFQKIYPTYALMNVSSRLWKIIYQTNNPGNNSVIKKIGFPIGITLFFVGLLITIFNIFNCKKRLLEIDYFFYALSTYIVMTLYLGLNWDRYYLPFVPVVIIFKSEALLFFVKQISSIGRKYVILCLRKDNFIK